MGKRETEPESASTEPSWSSRAEMHHQNVPILGKNGWTCMLAANQSPDMGHPGKGLTMARWLCVACRQLSQQLVTQGLAKNIRIATGSWLPVLPFFPLGFPLSVDSQGPLAASLLSHSPGHCALPPCRKRAIFFSAFLVLEVPVFTSHYCSTVSYTYLSHQPIERGALHQSFCKSMYFLYLCNCKT
jgi:hypothetical protein